jgi:small subunit ribosomal protein S17
MENDIVSDEEETAAPAEEAVASADAEATPAEAEPEAEAGADAEPEAAAEPDAAAGDLGDSASAEAPAKRKKKRLPRALRPQKTRPKPKRAAGERKPIVRLEKPAQERGRRQERQGTVVSDAMEKTIVVEVAVVKAHPKYKKVVRRSVKFHAHDERSEAKVGDLVRIVETRPLSKTKRWRLAEILQAAK